MILVRCACLPLLLLFLLVVTGCGGRGGSSEAFPKIEGQTLGPHGGVAVPIADKGYIELVLEPAGSEGDVQLVAYFLQPDMQAPIDAILTDVNAQIVTPIEDYPSVEFASQPGSATASNRFVATDGDFDFDELHGEIKATIDREAFSSKFSFR